MSERQPYGQGFRMLYPGLLNADLQDSYQVLVNPEAISPLLRALVQENQVLREEVRLRKVTLQHYTQLDLTCGNLDMHLNINGSLLEENRELGLHLMRKDEDLQRVIESHLLEDSEEVCDLRHQQELFVEENTLLLKHLEELKVEWIR